MSFCSLRPLPCGASGWFLLDDSSTCLSPVLQLCSSHVLTIRLNGSSILLATSPSGNRKPVEGSAFLPLIGPSSPRSLGSPPESTHRSSAALCLQWAHRTGPPCFPPVQLQGPPEATAWGVGRQQCGMSRSRWHLGHMLMKLLGLLATYTHM